MPVSALSSRHGIGDLGQDAYDFADIAVASKFKIWQILPLNPLGYGNSPYQPYSSFAGDEIYINLDLLKEEGLLEEVPSFQAYSQFIKYDEVREFKESYLRKAFRNFKETEDYKELYEEFKSKYTVMSYEEKLKEAGKLIEAFKKLEAEKIFFNRFNPDNLVISDGKYKFRFLNYIKTNSNGSLSSTNSSLSKKSSLYQSPEYIEKNIGKESNIYILGLMLYEIFYGYHIITGIIDSSLSLENKEKVREAFYFEKDILIFLQLEHFHFVLSMQKPKHLYQ